MAVTICADASHSRGSSITFGEIMKPVSRDTVAAAIEILGEDGVSSEEVESRVTGLVGDPMTARRLIDWIPEAFGLAVVSHLANVKMPTEFQAKDSTGKWVTVPLIREPIFAGALQIAQSAFHNGPRSVVRNISSRSAILSAANKALQCGRKINGADLSRPALIGIPAEIYRTERKSIWKRLFGLSAKD